MGHKVARVCSVCVFMLCMCVSFSLCLTQPPPSRVAVVSGGEADQDLSNLKVKVRSHVVHKPAQSSGRRTQVKTLRPPAGSTAEDKEVGTTHFNVLLRCLFSSFSLCRVKVKVLFIIQMFNHKYTQSISLPLTSCNE